MAIDRSSEPSLRQYLRELARIAPLAPGEEQVLAPKLRAGDPDALRRLVEANLRFVVSYAKRYRGLGLPFQDLINAGNVGMIEAAKRFDPDRGVKFITYAVWWVKQAILHALAEQKSVFHVPQKQAALMLRLNRADSELRQSLERPPTHEELACELNLSEHEVEELLAHRGEEVALDTLTDPEHEHALIDRMEQHLVPATDRDAIDGSFRQSVRQVLGELDEKERTIIGLRFGLEDDEALTLQQIGERMGVSRERVRQIETQALAKLRRSIRARRLLGHLN